MLYIEYSMVNYSNKQTLPITLKGSYPSTYKPPEWKMFHLIVYNSCYIVSHHKASILSGGMVYLLSILYVLAAV